MKRRVGISVNGLSHVSIQSGEGGHCVTVKATDTKPEIIHFYQDRERALSVWSRARQILEPEREIELILSGGSDAA